MSYDDLELWGMGVLGLSRPDFFKCSFAEINTRIKGFILRELEYKNIGARRIATLIHNLGTAFGGQSLSENKLWPMSFDKKFNHSIPKSEDLVEKDRELISKIWPEWEG